MADNLGVFHRGLDESVRSHVLRCFLDEWFDGATYYDIARITGCDENFVRKTITEFLWGRRVAQLWRQTYSGQSARPTTGRGAPGVKGPGGGTDPRGSRQGDKARPMSVDPPRTTNPPKPPSR